MTPGYCSRVSCICSSLKTHYTIAKPNSYETSDGIKIDQTVGAIEVGCYTVNKGSDASSSIKDPPGYTFGEYVTLIRVHAICIPVFIQDFNAISECSGCNLGAILPIGFSVPS